MLMLLVSLPVIVVLLLLVEVGACAIAYRINCGHKGLDIDIGRLLRLSLIAAAFTVVVFFLFVAAGMVYPLQELGVPGLVLIGLFVTLVQAQWLNWVYGLESWFSGLGLVFLRIIPYLLIAVPMHFVIRSLGGSLL